ncbi:alpha-1,2-fucosyltransferase [Pedobacter sp. AW31-3R]|uniref:alpha-1,2-fucosyltransferase n=1 Tax=Pedobacter sp. AW31-3R TaxID=3445781 RepID=UPI003FA140AF
MKIVRFLGGLGNQMFQFAFYKALENKFKNVKADISHFDNYRLHNGYELEKIFNISIHKASSITIKLFDPSDRSWAVRKVRRILGLKNAYREEKKWFEYESDIFNDPGNRIYWGYWQNQKYFQDITEDIRKCFQFKENLDERNTKLLEMINGTESVSIHIRRGDYLGNTAFGEICDKKYYQKASDLILEKVKNPVFFVFSNDIGWCEKNLDLPNMHFSMNSGNQAATDMHLMSKCKYNIIANSSFSWWAAWLNIHPDKIVIAPAKWINDPSVKADEIQLKDWICIQ